LYLKVEDVFSNNQLPMVMADTSLRDVILEISSKRLGATAVVDEEKNLLGIITDGDLRRMLEKTNSIANLQAKDIMSSNPKTIAAETLAVYALEEMRKHNISQLVAEHDHKYAGIIHLHDLVKEGII
jgi:arabinose-5-phosphate isomerase